MARRHEHAAPAAGPPRPRSPHLGRTYLGERAGDAGGRAAGAARAHAHAVDDYATSSTVMGTTRAAMSSGLSPGSTQSLFAVVCCV